MLEQRCAGRRAVELIEPPAQREALLRRLAGAARRVARMLANINSKVNLIALNPGPGIPFETPSDERVSSFQEIVRKSVPCFVRKPRGRDIFAACGQLKRNEAKL